MKIVSVLKPEMDRPLDLIEFKIHAVNRPEREPEIFVLGPVKLLRNRQKTARDAVARHREVPAEVLARPHKSAQVVVLREVLPVPRQIPTEMPQRCRLVSKFPLDRRIHYFARRGSAANPVLEEPTVRMVLNVAPSPARLVIVHRSGRKRRRGRSRRRRQRLSLQQRLGKRRDRHHASFDLPL